MSVLFFLFGVFFVLSGVAGFAFSAFAYLKLIRPANQRPWQLLAIVLSSFSLCCSGFVFIVKGIS